jgi:CAAX protease family protein
MTSRISSEVKRRPLVAFFVLAFALSWWAWILYALELSPMPILSCGPFLAAIVLLALTRGKAGVKDLFSRIVRWRVGLRWYAVELLLPVGLSAVATALNLLVLGARYPSSTELGDWTSLFATFAITLLVPGFAGTWEEPGWRGYALPRLQSGRSALVASLIIGIFWALWHLPLMMVGEAAWSDLVQIVAVSVVFAWVFNNANGSVLIVMLMHAMNNTISGHFFSRMFSGPDSAGQSLMLVVVWCAVAIAVVAVAGPAHLSRKDEKQEEPPETKLTASTTSQTRGKKEVLK